MSDPFLLLIFLEPLAYHVRLDVLG
jgi:hypothetical protein